MMSSVDFYRRIPKDLTESTSLGAIMSLVAITIMIVLFVSETYAFLTTNIATSVVLDPDTTELLRLNFNLTFQDLHCDYASVDVLDSLGTNRQNVTKNVEKWQLDSNGIRRIFSGRNREVKKVVQQEHSASLEEMHEDGVHAVVLTRDTIDEFIKSHEMAYINFFAPWCIWCQRLHPTWERFAEEVEYEEMPVGVGTVDCVEQADVCRKYMIRAFPSLKWFSNGSNKTPDYKGDRTVDALVDYATRMVHMDTKYKDWQKAAADKGEDAVKPFGREEHMGCQISGYLLVNRVPGNFHVIANSVNHNLNPSMTNLTHTVNHLSFGEAHRPVRMRRNLAKVPDEYKQFTPINGESYITREFHRAFHHYIKVVSTTVDFDKSPSVPTYQFISQSQSVHYRTEEVPEARFSYDISPMAVVITREGRKWYDYLTSLFAIIGGTFTTLGLIDATLYKMFKAKKI
uniref:Thioredoxin domain-containing protein n=1 Tax=Corethron hystrix TaxID=216773 RepID=A0A7S1FM79_9STRA